MSLTGSRSVDVFFNYRGRGEVEEEVEREEEVEGEVEGEEKGKEVEEKWKTRSC